MDLRRLVRPKMICAHHHAQRAFEGARGVGKEGGDAGERLFFLGVKDVEDHTNEQRMTRLLPVTSPFQTALGVDQDVGDVLDVADLVAAFAHLHEWVVSGARRIGRIEQQAVRESCTPPGGKLPVLALDIVNYG